MKPFHIFSYLSGEQDAQVAVIRIDPSDPAVIAAARAAVSSHIAVHSGHACMRHSHSYAITFLKDVPEGIPIPFIDGNGEQSGELCMDDIYDTSIAVHDLDDSTLERLAEEQELNIRSETEGLLVYPDSIYITGYEKHGEELLESLDISNLIPFPEASGFQTPLDPLEALRLIAAATDVHLANGNSEPDVMASSLDDAHNALAEIQGLVRRTITPVTA